MSDATPSVATRPDYEHYLAQHAARARLESECRPANKAALFDALAVAGITIVVVTFDGYGDSGQIESIDARTAEAEATLPDATITLADPLWDGSGVEPVTVGVAEAIERLSYDFLREVASGWENNDGAFGEFTFDVAARTIALDYNERLTTSESYAYAF
jgi:hypothetical protein